MEKSIEEQLYLSVLRNKPEITKTLIAQGADINTINQGGDAPVHIAVSREGDIENLKLLIENGANLDILNSEGYSPAHIAVLDSNYEALKLLLDNGANKNIKDPDGNSLLISAVAHYQGDDKIIKMLLEYKIDPSLANKHGNTLYKLIDMPKNKSIKHLFE